MKPKIEKGPIKIIINPKKLKRQIKEIAGGKREVIKRAKNQIEWAINIILTKN